MPFRIPARTLWQASKGSMKPYSFAPINSKTPQWTRRYAASSTEPPTRTAIVTGSARGIGKAIALRLAQDGYDICVNDISANKTQAESVVREIQQLGRKAIPYTADVSQLSEVQSMVSVKALLDLTEHDLKRMFEVNVYGVYNCYSTAAKQMIAQGTPGKILGAASIVAFKPFALLSHYSASKWAVRGLTQAFAMEVAEHKITVNAYAPGIVGTAMWDLIDEELGKKQGAKKGDTIKKYSEELIALGRTSVPEDVSNTVSFLCSKDSDYMTGQTIVIDGGIIFT
ncbi:unnamed protein product [Periconia digitata]|uniref:Acetoin dehydrogenase-like protein n=1 Tax=Periconia digitata TaxID=1303443 RepID=A0A9W4XCZ6_9PLEO|nr:unnamed protein product [Periconia digitata]